MSLVGSIVLSGIPAPAYADTPTYDPVFYYYHPDHLGSAQLMTDRAGEVVQHYGYSPYGSERYRANDDAFSVSNRYTGQTLDEDTGLYYYGARYYDPELARFIQADSTVPDPEFSQAYNRYAYVYNNPLKFTDPTGQNPFAIAAIIASAIKTAAITAFISAGIAAAMGGDISKAFISGLIGGFCGAIGGVVGAMAGGALGALATGGDPLQGALYAGVAVGVQVCLGFSPTPSTSDVSAGQFLKELALSTASGALCGGVTAEISGGTFAQGAAAGAAGTAAGYSVMRALTQEHLGVKGAGGREILDNDVARVTYKQEGDWFARHKVLRNWDEYEKFLIDIAKSGRRITFYEHVSHGLIGLNGEGTGITVGNDALVVKNPGPCEYALGQHISLFRGAFHPDAKLELETCRSAYSRDSIAYEFKRWFPHATVKGYTGYCQPYLPGTWETHRNVNPLQHFNPGSKFITVK